MQKITVFLKRYKETGRYNWYDEASEHYSASVDLCNVTNDPNIYIFNFHKKIRLNLYTTILEEINNARISEDLESYYSWECA